MSFEVFSQPAQYVKGVGPERARILKKLGVETITDLIHYFPRDWDDRRNIKPISQLTPNLKQTMQGVVLATSEEKKGKNLTITKVAISDKSGSVYATWFNQPYMKDKFKKGEWVILTGKVEQKFNQRAVSNPEYEIVNQEDNLNTGRIVPIYPLTEGLSQRVLRNIVKTSLDKISPYLREPLPREILVKHCLKDISPALNNIHFPENWKEKEEAYYRIVFEEFFFSQTWLALKRKGLKRKKGVSYTIPEDLLNSFYQLLPYELTLAQRRVIEEIKLDMKKSEPMNRLIQGDVGSGKTVVALVALLIAVSNGYQAALMAPTEVLAEQHYLVTHPFLSSLGVKVDLLIGSLPEREKKVVQSRIKKGEVQVCIGTHALIQEGVEFKRLGLAIIDEQHRFGVMQRAILRQKGYNPEILVMTATPIPRTLSLTLYGDLDLSVIDEMPSGRKPVLTKYLPLKKREEVYQFVRQQVREGRQVYIVCPLILESETLEVEAATKLVEHLRRKVFPDFRVGLLHGKLKTKEKEEIMHSFKEGNIDILTSTTVIEVGIDVPNVTVMVIENAERFGLAQLHQLRGRVGRDSLQSYCILLTDLRTEEARRRMKVMTKTSDGFVIAEEDLQIRGPGELYGTKQHGLPSLNLANILKDADILEAARKEAFLLVEKDPKLREEGHRLLKSKLLEKFEGSLDLISVS